MGAWSVGVVEGSPQGPPKMVKPDMGPIESLGFTQKGSYYYGVRKKMNDVYIAEISPSSGDVVAPPQKAIQHFEGYNQAPAYSPDGKFLAYISSRSHLLTRSGFTRGGNVLCIKSLETNEIHEIRPEIDMIGYPTWSPDGKSIDVVHWNVNDGIELFRIEVETGKVTIISQPDDNHSHFGGHKWSPSGETFYYGLIDRNERSCNIIARDIESNTDKILYKSGDFYTISISPDGQWFALTCPSNEDAHIKIVSTNGDESRELYRFKPGINLGRFPSTTWTADGKYILFGICDNEIDEETYELCRISVEGGEFEKLGLKKKGVFLNLSAHPDGRHIAYSSDENIAEIWVMENFLPEN
jgi:Tol biopolymer transport system component